MTASSFWKEARQSLPPEIRERHAAEFEAAERFEHLIECAAEVWGAARRALTKGRRRAADALHSTARFVRAVARERWRTH
ncbi:MAG: hypothetical protein HYY28_03165 [Betaproteobacteria bacterium]|nr:hypothetical protein [Betaproteobacteria bacterium]MBI2959289.1 hypothetical protein [Betaproteobacteria bacterium]